MYRWTNQYDWVLPPTPPSVILVHPSTIFPIEGFQIPNRSFSINTISAQNRAPMIRVASYKSGRPKTSDDRTRGERSTERQLLRARREPFSRLIRSTTASNQDANRNRKNLFRDTYQNRCEKCKRPRTSLRASLLHRPALGGHKPLFTSNDSTGTIYYRLLFVLLGFVRENRDVDNDAWRRCPCGRPRSTSSPTEVQPR